MAKNIILWRFQWQQPLVALWIVCAYLSSPVDSNDFFLSNQTLSSNETIIPLGIFDICANAPCQHNSTCLPTSSADSLGSSFLCHCSTGWTGRLCDVDIDECSQSLNPCKNGAMCRNFAGGFQCYCVPGYLGEFCDMEANECLTDPCRNNATCVDKLNGFHCTCLKGYTGKRCDREINECQPNPCLNDGHCSDLIGAYNCTCPLGFTGLNCQINIDNCQENPCQNHGRCVDGVNNFTCNCLDTGFSGRFCQHEIDDCASSPCQHNGTCQDIGKDYRCRCFDGYLGKNCEVDIDECQEPSPPCRNNATCYERSNISLHIDRTLIGLDRAFSYEHSAGYICVCPPGFKGKNCEVEIDECEPGPCIHGNCRDLVNGYECTCGDGWQGRNCDGDVDECTVGRSPCSRHGRCENHPGWFECRCDAGFGGGNCTVRLTGCEEVVCRAGQACPLRPRCAEGSTCSPYLTSEFPVALHDFHCLCPVDRAGRYCQSSSVASFALDGYLQLLNASLVNVSLDFRTTLQDSLVLLAFQPALILHVQINNGRVELNVSDRAAMGKLVTFGQTVSDGRWYTLGLVLGDNLVTGWLRSAEEDGVPGGVPERQTVSVVGFRPNEMVFSQVYFGGVEHRVRTVDSAYRLGSNMIGCMRNININGDVLVPSEMTTATRFRQTSVRDVCERKEQCTVDACNRRGRCSDLWNHYECVCDRPYYGLSCEKEIQPGTFGYNNTASFITVNLTEPERADSELRNHFSFRIRTRQNSSTVFYMGSQDGTGFILLRLIDGRLMLRIKLSNVLEPIFGPPGVISDGMYHYVDILREQTAVRIVVDDGQPTYGMLTSGSPLSAEILILGRHVIDEGNTGRGKRNSDADGAVVVKRETGFPGGFKGIIQDFRLNGKLVAFFGATAADQLEGLPPTFRDVTVVDVVEGVVSDNTCLVEPCLNGGTCQVTWNDFHCICPVAFRGKTCQSPNFCLSNECPSPEAQCKTLENDYECRTSVSFLKSDSYIQYTPTRANLTFRSVSFRIRTRSAEATNILSLTSNKHQLKIYLKNARIQLEYRLNTPSSIVTIDHAINDAVWRNFSVEFLPRQMNLLIDGESFTQEIPQSDIALSTILQEDGGSVRLGGDFTGCLDDIRLGHQLLPFFPLLKLHTSADLPRSLTVEKVHNIQFGCQSPDFCRLHPCQRGKCRDLWWERRCECDPAVDGPACNQRNRMEPLPDPCADLECQNGGTPNCEGGISNRTNDTVPGCVCPEGFVGNLCETHVAVSAAAPDQLAIILGVTLSVVFLILISAVTAFCITARKKRAERGTYSPNRHDHFGRLEMDFVLKPPPKEGLI